jgi:ATP synthase subunit 6
MNTKFNIFLNSPLEQFNILPLISFYFRSLDFSFTNSTTIVLLTLIFFVIIYRSFLKKNATFCVIPNRWQAFLEKLYKTILSLVLDIIKSKLGQHFFPLVFFLCVFIASVNIVGLIPYSFTLTSHLMSIGALSIAIFVGINIVCAQLHGINVLEMFLPAGTSTALGLLLVPIEMISFLFKPVSLSIRLFANMTAGHVLLKVVTYFSIMLIMKGGFSFFLLHVVPLMIIFVLFFLELGVALIQAYVFTILICIYINDAINLH